MPPSCWEWCCTYMPFRFAVFPWNPVNLHGNSSSISHSLEIHHPWQHSWGMCLSKCTLSAPWAHLYYGYYSIHPFHMSGHKWVMIELWAWNVNRAPIFLLGWSEVKWGVLPGIQVIRLMSVAKWNTCKLQYKHEPAKLSAYVVRRISRSCTIQE